MVVQRFAPLIGHLKADFGNLGAHLEYDPLDAAPGRKITSRCTPRRQARQMRQSTVPASWSISSSTSALVHRFSLLLHQPQLPHLGLDRDVGSIGLTAWRLLLLAPQVSQVGNAALVERIAVTHPINHAFGFELADVGPGAIEVQRKRRRADGLGLSGWRSRDWAWRRTRAVSVMNVIPVASQ
jgi:hypothetical protein